jgi:outer membrane protein assembly factor BamB
MTASSAKRIKPLRRIKLANEPFGVFRMLVGPQGIYIGDRYRDVSKLHRSSLERAWRFKGEDLVPLALHGDVLLIGGSEGVYGVAEQTGAKLWGPSFVGRCVQWDQHLVVTRPLAVLETRDGSILRTFPLDVELAGDVLIGGGVLVGTTLKGDVVAGFHLGEQRLLWRKDLFTEINDRVSRAESMSLVLGSDETFLVSRTDMLVGCSMHDGAVRWQSSLGVPYCVPNVIGGRAFVLSGGETTSARFVCVEVDSGRTVYDVPQPTIHLGDRPFRGTVVGDEIVHCTHRNLVLAFRIVDGALSWWCQANDSVSLTIAADGRILAPTGSGNLLVLDLPG